MKIYQNLNKENLEFKNNQLNQPPEETREIASRFVRELVQRTNRESLVLWTVQKIELVVSARMLYGLIRMILSLRSQGKSVNEIIEYLRQQFSMWFFNWNNEMINTHAERRLRNLDVLMALQNSLLSFFANENFVQLLRNHLADPENFQLHWPVYYISLSFNQDSTENNISQLRMEIDQFVNQVEFFYPVNVWIPGLEVGGQLCQPNNKYQSNTKNLAQKFHSNKKNVYEIKCNKPDQPISTSKMIKYWLKKIQAVLNDCTDYNNKYYQLFNFFNEENLKTELFKNKIIYKLIKIINLKYPQLNYKIMISALGNVNPIFNCGYSINLKINLYDEKNLNLLITEKFNFHWLNRSSFLNIESWENIDYIATAIEEISKLNKMMFYRFHDPKGYSLLNFIQGVLDDISPEFKIIKEPHNLSNKLKDVNFTCEITFKNKRAFDVTILEDGIYMIIYNGDGTIGKIEKKNHQTGYSTNSDRTIDKWKKVTKTLNSDFKNLWSKQDLLYDLIKTVQQLFRLNSEKTFKVVKITTSHNPKQNLSRLYYRKNTSEGVIKLLNFDWFLNSYNFRLEINNPLYIKIDLINSKNQLVKMLWEKIIKIYLNLVQFKTNQELYDWIKYLALEIDYSLEIKPNVDTDLTVNFKKDKFTINILIDNQLINSVKLDWKDKSWILLEGSKDKVKIKDEL